MSRSLESPALPSSRAEEVRARLAAATPGSRRLYELGGEVLVQEVVGTVEMPHPLYIESARGARLTDVDGNSYLDLTMGFGPHVLGHAPPVVADAIRRQLAKGWHFGIHNPLQEPLARLLQAAAPAVERTVFCNSGTEATMYAMRVARAFTGREKIGLFDGAYHGAHDQGILEADWNSPRSRPSLRPRGRGVLPAATDAVVALPYRDPAAFELIAAHAAELAMVLVEPVQSSNPRLDVGPFLQTLREVCSEHGVLLALDEVITGFRLAYGGAQELFGVVPDLATYGKVLGGGLPIGAVGGRADIMARFDMNRRGSVFSGGTFSGNPLTMAAGVAAVTHLRDHPEVYTYLAAQGSRLAGAVNTFCRAEGYAAQVMHAGSMLYFKFQAGAIESARDLRHDTAAVGREFYLHLLGHGVVVPGIHLAFLSAAHTPADVELLIEAITASFRDLRADGRL